MTGFESSLLPLFVLFFALFSVLFFWLRGGVIIAVAPIFFSFHTQHIPVFTVQATKRVAYLFVWPLLEAGKISEKSTLPPSNVKYFVPGNN